jgi:DNA repair exonuclease SbcCD ATPase subunit
MIQVELLSLTLKNFKGIRNFTLDVQGQDTDIYGDNAAGKSTLADAAMWLLFDKDSQNRKDFEIKTLGPNGEPEHGLEHSVEGVYRLPDGRLLTLKKVFQEKWTKKRGSATAEFTGHTTDHFIDGVPVKKSEYDARIAEIADEQVFRLLTDPRYFNEALHWQKRRELLLQVCGDVTDTEVIGSQAELAKLIDILGNRTIEQHRKTIQARRTEINRELEKIPVRIDEVMRGLPDISQIIPDALETDIQKLRAQIEVKQQELARAEAGGEIAEKRKQLVEVETRLLQIKNEHQAKVGDKLVEKQRVLNEMRMKTSQLQMEINNGKTNADLFFKRAQELEVRIRDKRDKWYEVNEREFEYDPDTVCPTCGQDLPAEKLAEAREKALAQFNRQKAQELEQIAAEGKQMQNEREDYMQHHSSLVAGINEREAGLSELKAQCAVFEKQLKELASLETPITENPAYIQKLQEKEQIEAVITQLRQDASATMTAIKSEISTFHEALRTLENEMANLKHHKQGLKRIDELKAEERKLAAEFEDIEHQLYLTDEFIRTKVRMLEEKINSKFKMARFKSFDVQVNGALAECCETTFNGVPYSNLNSGARLNVGLDIINTLAEHFAFAPVVFIDNAESVVNILPTKGQQIRLIVSAADKKLRIELAEKKELKEAV